MGLIKIIVIPYTLSIPYIDYITTTLKPCPVRLSSGSFRSRHKATKWDGIKLRPTLNHNQTTHNLNGISHLVLQDVFSFVSSKSDPCRTSTFFTTLPRFLWTISYDNSEVIVSRIALKRNIKYTIRSTRALSQYKDRLIYVWRFPC